MTEDYSSTEVTTRKNIESVIPVKRVPNGWVFRDELLAPWESNLPLLHTGFLLHTAVVHVRVVGPSTAAICC